MQKFAAIIVRFPDQELAIRRLCMNDDAARSVCEDYDDATIAWRRWEGAGAEFAKRAEEYRVILIELEQEILSLLRRS